MEVWALVAIAMLLWMIVAPLLGVIGFFKVQRLNRDIQELRRRLVGETPTPSDAKATARPPATPPLPAAAAPPKPSFYRPPPRPKRPSRDWERLIAANWTIWAGGLALAMGGLLLVRFAIDAGLFNETARTIAGGVLGVGLSGLSLFAQRWRLLSDGEGAVKFVPAVLAAAGVTALYGAALAAR
ncbi:MAG: DUF2339 domain-containing protein, partial [Pseudomonadota bacterium]